MIRHVLKIKLYVITTYHKSTHNNSHNRITTIKTSTQTQLQFYIALNSCGQTETYLKTHCRTSTTYVTHAYNYTTQQLLLNEHKQKKKSNSTACHATMYEKCDKLVEEIT
jgi:hypothetical protein